MNSECSIVVRELDFCVHFLSTYSIDHKVNVAILQFPILLTQVLLELAVFFPLALRVIVESVLVKIGNKTSVNKLED